MYNLPSFSVLINVISSKQTSGAAGISENFVVVFDQLDALKKFDQSNDFGKIISLCEKLTNWVIKLKCLIIGSEGWHY